MLAKALFQFFIRIVWIVTAQPEQQFVGLVRPVCVAGHNSRSRLELWSVSHGLLGSRSSRSPTLSQNAYSVLFKIGDAAGLIANTRLDELLRSSFGLPWFRKTVIHCRDVALRRLMNRVVCFLPYRVIAEAKVRISNPSSAGPE